MAQPRAWQRMLSGRRLDLLDPTPMDIEVEDIAHGLAFVARWNGQTIGDYAYSVAEHSLLVTDIFTAQNPSAPVKWQLAALLHDAPEYVIGDMISPVKAAVGPNYGLLDDRLMAAIHIRFGLPAQLPTTIKKLIKKADKISAWLEAVQIAGFTAMEADKLFGKIEPNIAKTLQIRLRPPVEVRHDFTEKHKQLMDPVMIMLNTRVRPAVNADAQQMVKLLNSVIAAGGTTAHQTPYDVKQMREDYIAPTRLISCHVAISNGRLSGFQFLGKDSEREGWAIIATFVALDRGKMGIGQKLFSATRFAAKDAGVKTIDATIRADNVGGLKYYSGLGFTDYDVLRQIPLNDGTPTDRIRKQLDL